MLIATTEARLIRPIPYNEQGVWRRNQNYSFALILDVSTGNQLYVEKTTKTLFLPADYKHYFKEV